jgi:hypothetical protein
MTIDKAETLVCPFQRSGIKNEQYCITTECMAWKMTQTKSDQPNEQYTETTGFGRHRIAWRRSNLPHQDCKGHCLRLKQ